MVVEIFFRRSAEGNYVGGVEFTLSVRGSIPNDGTLTKAQQQVCKVNVYVSYFLCVWCFSTLFGIAVLSDSASFCF
jgi:hypothetical protein